MKEKILLKVFLQYTVLNICGMLGLSCYILADTFFVSKGLGTKGLTALNLAVPIYSFVHGTGLMLGMGGATKYSVFRGQKDFKNANKIYKNTVYAMALFAIIFMLTGIFCSERLTLLLGADIEVFDMTRIYLQIILLFAPAFIANDVLLCFIRNDGNPRLSMAAMTIGSLSNIVFDYVLIFPLHMGIFGAVLATGFAPVISLGILSRHWIRKQNQFYFGKERMSAKLICDIFSLGIPSLITEVASGIVMIVFNTVILELKGNIGVAAYGVVANLSLVVTSVFTGIAQGIQPLLSRFYGYGNKKNIGQILNYAIKTALFLSGFLYLGFLIASVPVVEIFNSEENARLQQIAETGMRLYFTAVPFVGFNIIISTYFTSVEKALPAQIISLSRGFTIIIPMAFFMSALFEMTGVWLSYPLTESMVTFVGIVMMKVISHSTKKEDKP